MATQTTEGHVSERLPLSDAEKKLLEDGSLAKADIQANPRIPAALIAAGYSAADVEKIWSGNILRVLRQVEAARTR